MRLPYPDPLYSFVAIDPQVHFQQLRAEDYLPQIEREFALITNDMRMDARESARLMVAYASHLRPHGIAIMTLKLRLRNRQRLMDHAFRILRKAYKVIRVRQLVSNGKEVTLFLRRKD